MGVKRQYRLSPAADRDLADIWLYTASQWSVEQAESYQDKLAAAFEGLAAGTKKGRPVAVGRKDYLKYAVGSHIVYFRETKSEIIIVRVLHGRMDAERYL
ncbi:type II toxin-antitoxin system RelE/ParE family toxin [Phyllobacterium leguminum]|uniref:Toxin n=1 Tax=Phyllobacterium leguminum TaxID=314237 RepID=A0A318T1A6_9HYPH|nr:type II toxin-antitoxin system RelE/ParE family toxin [Phyllobacterium leguminum]PYE87476.1 toxin ParE1/3/4 [Phyllobacterium leguminum]